MSNETIYSGCVLLPDIVMFPAGCGKAEDIGRGKMAEDIEDQSNWNVHYRLVWIEIRSQNKQLGETEVGWLAVLELFRPYFTPRHFLSHHFPHVRSKEHSLTPLENWL